MPWKVNKSELVVSVNADRKGIVTDVGTFPSYPVPVMKPNKGEITKTNKEGTNNNNATILHRDVRRLVILLPIEEQPEAWKTGVTSLDLKYQELKWEVLR